MTIARKYIRQCRTLFPVYGKSERTFLNRLKVQVNEHLDLFPDLSYENAISFPSSSSPCTYNILLFTRFSPAIFL